MRPLHVAILALTILLPACGDDDPASPEVFQVIIEVIDPQGQPVAGLDLALAPDTPFYGEKHTLEAPLLEQASELRAPSPCPFYPAVRIPGQLTEAGLVRLTIEDVAGIERRLLDGGPRDARNYTWIWDGRDDSDDIVPSGVFYAHLVIRDPSNDEVVLDQRHPMLLARLDDGDTGIGATDADGRIVIDDQRLFPFLYDVEPFAAMDENGEQIGLITLTATMRFYLSAPGTNQRRRYDRDVTGPANFSFTWDPAP